MAEEHHQTRATGGAYLDESGMGADAGRWNDPWILYVLAFDLFITVGGVAFVLRYFQSIVGWYIIAGITLIAWIIPVVVLIPRTAPSDDYLERAEEAMKEHYLERRQRQRELRAEHIKRRGERLARLQRTPELHTRANYHPPVEPREEPLPGERRAREDWDEGPDNEEDDHTS